MNIEKIKKYKGIYMYYIIGFILLSTSLILNLKTFYWAKLFQFGIVNGDISLWYTIKKHIYFYFNIVLIIATFFYWTKFGNFSLFNDSLIFS